jgi:adenylate cyclase
VTDEELRRICDLGIITPTPDGRLTPAHLRRLLLVQALTNAGVPLDGLGAALRAGQVSIDFIDSSAYDRFWAPASVTFQQLSEQHGVPVERLTVIREASGSLAAQPHDHVRSEELPIIDMLIACHLAGFRPTVVRQMMRVEADAMRRVAETENALWTTEVIGPAVAAGKRADEAFGGELGDRMSVLSERALVAMFHTQQTQAWTASIIEALEGQLGEAGLHTRVDHPPAMCFFDISGFTRLTQEQGDAAAAQLADDLGDIVHRESRKLGGRAVKWLGDGVMLHFPNPAHGVEAALEMVDGVVRAGLPPAHVGLHAGPVIFQEGDYYGQTVNLAARIAAYARPGQVLVSQAVVDEAGSAAIFGDVGPVRLKGVAGATRLYAAQRPS